MWVRLGDGCSEEEMRSVIEKECCWFNNNVSVAVHHMSKAPRQALASAASDIKRGEIEPHAV